MTGKKAVLNVTVDESLAKDVRRAAKLGHTTISSVVERALREKLSWELKRLEGIRAIEAYYEEHGYPTPEVVAEAKARVDEEHRLAEEARAYNAAHGNVLPPRRLGPLMEQVLYDCGALIAIGRSHDSAKVEDHLSAARPRRSHHGAGARGGTGDPRSESSGPVNDHSSELRHRPFRGE